MTTHTKRKKSRKSKLKFLNSQIDFLIFFCHFQAIGVLKESSKKSCQGSFFKLNENFFSNFVQKEQKIALLLQNFLNFQFLGHCFVSRHWHKVSLFFIFVPIMKEKL